MSKSLSEMYNDTFYKNQIEGSLASATVVFNNLFNIYRPNSVLDIGCGRGTWLYAAEKLGVTKLHGIDGPWLKQADMLSNNIEFKPTNMEVEISVAEKYDLAISVEVAEHISKTSARDFISSLCAASDVVLFGAAVTCQGGENHINEQRQSYWANLFSNQGYRCFDIIRNEIWDNESVEVWYRQNTLIYVNKDRNDLISVFEPLETNQMLDIIHPDMFENRVIFYRNILKKPTIRLILGLIKSYLVSKIKNQ